MSKKAKRVKNILLTVFRMFMFVVLSLVIGINVYIWNAKKLLGEALPMPFGYGVAVVLSGSMEPALSVDDIVVIKESDDVAIGDIVVFESNGSLIIHRVITIDGETVQTKGDANDGADEKITISDIKGELAFHIGGLGIIVHIMQKPMVLICIIVLMLVLLELIYKKQRNNETEKLDKAKQSIKHLTGELQSGSGEIDVEQLRLIIDQIEKELKDDNDK